MTGVPIDVLQRIPLFADLNEDELERIASVFKERRFAEGETVIQQGSGAAAFFVIDSGEARVLVDGHEKRVLKPGDHFGEMALIDAGVRTATVIAASDLRVFGCHVLGLPPAGGRERRDRLEAPAVADRGLSVGAPAGLGGHAELVMSRSLQRKSSGVCENAV